jgi:hypothetical protein
MIFGLNIAGQERRGGEERGEGVWFGVAVPLLPLPHLSFGARLSPGLAWPRMASGRGGT